MTANCGIYKITNTVTGDFYIGSAVDLRKRFSQHRSTLTANCHRNGHLQRSWNKYGEDKFIFETVLYCDKEHLLEREQIHMDLLKPTFNILRVAGSPLGVKRTDKSKRHMSEAHKGKTLTEETKQKMSEARMGERNPNFGKPMSEEQKQKLSEAHMGTHHTEESKLRMSEAGKGRKHTAESKQRMSATKKGELHPMFGKHHSDGSKRKIGEASRHMWAQIKAVAC